MSALRNFHEGEVKIQAEAGVDSVRFDEMVEQAFRPELSGVEHRFVQERTFSVAATLDSSGRPWASPLLGRAGELFSVENATTVRIRPQEIDGDPLASNIDATGQLGVLYFDHSRRRRAKSLGNGQRRADGSISYRMSRNYGLCNKYIFKRSHSMGALPETTAASAVAGSVAGELSSSDRDQLERTDTVFVASYHERHGVDPTHRGGPPGFVSVIDANTISIPDYMGNGMFQTLGNLLLDDRIGLLSVDYGTGRTVQLTGRGRVEPSPEDDPYSQRTMLVAIDEVRVTSPEVGEWTDIEPFELRPGLINPATPYL